MHPDPLDPAEVERMQTPLWEQARTAYAEGNTERGSELLDRAVERWRSLQDYSISWVTSLLTFVGEELGEEAVERALRRFGEEYVRARRETGIPWESLPAATRAKAIARAMVSNFGSVDVTEDDERITLSFRCGTGGRLVDEGRYEGPDAYLTLRERGPRTFGEESLPVYCAHCSINNELQPLEWGGVPTSVEFPTRRPGEPCVHHVYRDPRRLPDEAHVRLGRRPPASH